jgi:hypothetical protein
VAAEPHHARQRVPDRAGFPRCGSRLSGARGIHAVLERDSGALGTFSIEVERLEPVSDDRVLALFWFHGLGRQGVEVTSKFAQLFTLAEGMVKQQVGFGDCDQALEAVGLPE